MNRAAFADLLAAAVARRRALTDGKAVTAYRLFDGAGDGAAGVYVDRYGSAAVLNVYDDAAWDDAAITEAARAIADAVHVESVYVKRFSKDRSRLGGKAPAESISPTPRAGVPQPEASIIEEYRHRFEVRLYDGFSTGLFLEHREHRRWLADLGIKRALNLFAYTCAFSIPLTRAGAHVTNVDVSARYLDWGRRNHAINDIDEAAVRFVRMDAMAYLDYAARHPEHRFDLVIVDPPTFGAGNSRRKIKTWQAASGYPTLLDRAKQVLAPGGRIFAATNTRELANDDALKEMIVKASGPVEWLPLPPWPVDVRERGRVAAALFTPRESASRPRHSRPQPATRATPAARRGRARARR